MKMRVCTRCKKNLPATPEHFYRHSRSSDGLNWWCKECVKEYQKHHVSPNKHKRYSYVQPDITESITLKAARDRFKKKYKVGQHIKLRRKIAPGRPQPINGWISDMYDNVVIVNTGQYKEAFTYVDMTIGDVEVRK